MTREIAKKTVVPRHVILSFDIEEHWRIEAAVGLEVSADIKVIYGERMDSATRWLLDALAEKNIKATFFVVGEIARDNPALIQAIDRDGHEIGSHSWDHRRVHTHTPASFRDDVGRSKDALEQITGKAVLGYRAPTFSVMRETAWAIDELAELGLRYDSSIYPVRHDRYGVPNSPRVPYLVRSERCELLEIPPMTLQVKRTLLPTGGGGYFRLFPLAVMRWALKQTATCWPSVAMLYFHPWEFDPGQEKLPLRWPSRLRTYVGIGSSRQRLTTLMSEYQFSRACDVVSDLDSQRDGLARYSLPRGTCKAMCPCPDV